MSNGVCNRKGTLGQSTFDLESSLFDLSIDLYISQNRQDQRVIVEHVQK